MMKVDTQLTKDEVKTIKRTLSSIKNRLYQHNLYIVSQCHGGDPHKMGELGELNKAIKGPKCYKNAKLVLSYLENQYTFLSNNSAEAYKREPGSFKIIAEKLEPIMPKLRQRVKDLYELEQIRGSNRMNAIAGDNPEPPIDPDYNEKEN